jgi:tRNA(Ile)-lysidine synthase
MIARVRDFAARHGLWSPTTRVLVALSGGGDSVALLFLLDELRRLGDVQLAGACHVHHHIRGADADEDERFCRVLADRLGVPLVVAHRDVPALAAESRQSLEVAGRLARRTALVEAAGELQAERIATAHTRDDQAETVLLRIVRGAGISGLGGIAPAQGLFIRPVLDVSRQSLQAWLTTRGETWREDASNQDKANPRNRVRHELLPYLRAHFNPSADRALARLAEVARAEDAVLRAEADNTGVLVPRAGGVGIDRRGLAALPRAVARRVVRKALEAVNPSRSYDLEQVDLVYDSCGVRRSGPLEFRGVRVERNDADVVLLIKQDRAHHSKPFHYELSIPGRVTVPEAGCVVEAAGPLSAGGEQRLEWPREVLVPAEPFEAGLVIRSRAPGDRLRLRGVRGRVKLQDLFVNQKVSRSERDRTPIVTDAAGRIVWVGGLALSEEFRVSERTKAVVVLKLRRL